MCNVMRSGVLSRVMFCKTGVLCRSVGAAKIETIIVLLHLNRLHIIRVVATTPRKDPQPNISDLRDHSQSIFCPILTRVPKKKKKKKKVATPIY